MMRSLVALALVTLSGATASALRAGDTPPPIDLPDLAGEKVELNALQGKVVLVDFWASWCGPCKEQMPFLEELHQRYAEQGLVVVGVNVDRNPKKMLGFLKATPASFRIVHDAKTQVAQRYKPSTLPSAYLIGRDGKLRHLHEGFRRKDADEIEQRLRALLADEGR